MNMKLIHIVVLLFAIPFYVQASAVSDMEAKYKSQGAGPFNAAAGEALWTKTFIDSKSGNKRSCATCHTANQTKEGKHARTGKVIEPMAPSVNSLRFTETKKIKKWFVRNCKWTMGHECSPQMKGDFLAFLKTH